MLCLLPGNSIKADHNCFTVNFVWTGAAVANHYNGDDDNNDNDNNDNDDQDNKGDDDNEDDDDVADTLRHCDEACNKGHLE